MGRSHLEAWVQNALGKRIAFVTIPVENRKGVVSGCNT